MSDSNCSERASNANATITEQTPADLKISSEFTEDLINEPLKIIEPFEEDSSVAASDEQSIEINKDTVISPKDSLRTKKSVSFNPNDEKIRKFTTGEPIVDQKNPFKNGHINGKEKKTPPPVPTKRSTLSVRKTVTQQLREREREKEKEREKERELLKNEANTRKKNSKNSNSIATTPDEYITTEEVLKQSKYVKTYIKNPDAYFVYDPTVLARLKFEELRDIAGKAPKRKQTLGGTQHTANRSKEIKSHRLANKQEAIKPKIPTFKKCSKPNYPELSNIKIKTGTDSDGGNYLNAAEVTKNAKKFDERVKKLQISSDDDLDEIDGPLTKSESSDELTNRSDIQADVTPTTIEHNTSDSMNSTPEHYHNGQSSNEAGTFTNTIRSQEFQAYLERKGLALMPKKPATIGPPQKQQISAFQRPAPTDDPVTALRKNNNKKLSVLQRLSNSLFAAKRKTTPKGINPAPRTIYNETEDYQKYDTPTALRRVLLERQSYHGGRSSQLSQPQQHSPLKRSSNIEHNLRARDTSRAPLKPSEYVNGKVAIRKPANELWQQAAQRVPTAQPQVAAQEAVQQIRHNNQLDTPFQRTWERQSLIPRRVSPESKLQLFNRSASMDRNQIKANSQSQADARGTRRSLAGYVEGHISDERMHMMTPPNATSTPLRKTMLQPAAAAAAGGSSGSIQLLYPSKNQNEWEQLRAIKEVTDRQLYHKVLQQQQQQSEENIYEHLQHNQLRSHAAALQSWPSQQQFMRGTLQRNTFSGISGQNRQVMMPIQIQQQAQPPRCQSVMDEAITPNNHTTRRGYESDNETPVLIRRKEASASTRRIGGLLTREEILEKVKEFCRKSINRTPLIANKMQPIYERQHMNCANISPVSYASVETTHKRPASQLSATPQLPVRIQSLPQQRYVTAADYNGGIVTSSPIYAHVNKRNSLMSNDSEQYLSTQQLPQRDPTLLTLTPTEYILVETGEKIPASKVIDYHNNSVYVQPQFIGNNKQLNGAPQGYVRMEEVVQHVMQDGRSTPLILDRSSHQASQIYWTPQHQRLAQANLVNSMPISPRYATNQAYPIPAPRSNIPGRLLAAHEQQQQQQLPNGRNVAVTMQQQYATIVPAPRNLMQPQRQQARSVAARNASDWDCSIMEKSS